MRRVTLADVGRHCGVSAMTVSCVVRGVQCVKEATRKKVEAAIAELGYTSDPALRALASYRTKVAQKNTTYRSTIAYLDFEPSEYSQAMFDLTGEEAERLGYKIEYFQMPRSLREREQLSRKLWTQGIRGILLGPAQEIFPLDGFVMDEFAFVGLGAFHHSPAVDCVCPDYFRGLYLAAEECQKEGFRHIALYVVDFLEARTDHRWLGAYHAFCDHNEMSPRIWLYGKDSKHGQKEFSQWLKDQEIDVVLTLGDNPFADQSSRVRFVSLNDWNVPSDWGYVGTSKQMMLQEAIRLLDQQLQHQEYGSPQWPKKISIASQWYAAAD